MCNKCGHDLFEEHDDGFGCLQPDCGCGHPAGVDAYGKALSQKALRKQSQMATVRR